ncbi:MAG: PilZ domain-containing protein [Planctomycetota bacterium]|nr:PilZ domain-containing protein [Planctomycetota bacterium]
MKSHERRRAERVEVGIPAQIYTHRGFLDAKVCDLSRTGLRLRLRVKDLDLEATEDLRSAAEAVASILGDQFALDLDYRKLGPLLQRGVELTRIALPVDEPLFVELCCSFDEPLNDAVTDILQTELPPVRTVALAVAREVEPPRACSGVMTMRSADELRERPVKLPPVEPEPKPSIPPVRHRYRALVTGTSKEAPPAFFCHTDLVTAVGVRVCISRPRDASGVRETMTKLVKVHGHEVDVRLLDAKTDVWSGPARVTGVELPPDRRDVMLVTLAFARPLGLPALRQLGLVAA